MLNQNTTAMAQSQTVRLCKNFGCENAANPGWNCCGDMCGFEHRRDKHYFENVKAGNVAWDDPFWGIKYWSAEKILYYYLNSKPCQTNKQSR